jgi:tetraacyldisaccharide-1-P 4'-kinase
MKERTLILDNEYRFSEDLQQIHVPCDFDVRTLAGKLLKVARWKQQRDHANSTGDESAEYVQSTESGGV